MGLDDGLREFANSKGAKIYTDFFDDTVFIPENFEYLVVNADNVLMNTKNFSWSKFAEFVKAFEAQGMGQGEALFRNSTNYELILCLQSMRIKSGSFSVRILEE